MSVHPAVWQQLNGVTNDQEMMEQHHSQKTTQSEELTVKAAVVLVAAPTEQRVKRMHRLFTRHRDRIRSVDVWRTLQRDGDLLLLFLFCQLTITDTYTDSQLRKNTLTLKVKTNHTTLHYMQLWTYTAVCLERRRSLGVLREEVRTHNPTSS